MKILYLFLDVDGVLNDKGYWNKFKKKYPQMSDVLIPYIPFNPKSLKNLVELNKRLKRKKIKMEIVLTSSWRKYVENMAILHAKMFEIGLTISYKTPIRNSKDEEITIWLKRYNNPQNYLVIDDLSLSFEDNHFVRTDMQSGFTRKKLKECLKKIKKMR